MKKYKLNSDVEIKDISGEYVVGIISNEKFAEIKRRENKSSQTFIYRSSPFFKTQDLKNWDQEYYQI